MKRNFGSDHSDSKIFLGKKLDFFSKDAIIMITVIITNIEKEKII